MRDDTISRQAAIDAVDVSNLHRGIVSALQEIIRELPSAQPQRKKGKWIGEPKDGIEMMFFKPKCSVCGFESAEVKNYCPNCGADMRGEE